MGFSLSVALLALIASAALLVSAGMFGQILGRARDARKCPPPGRLLQVGGHRLHLYCTGEGTPTVVMDSGLPGTSLSWAFVQPEVAKFTRVCSYDRAGLGWSEMGPKPRTTERIVQELHALLHNAGIEPPYVLVGHSFGGFTARLFAARYPEEVAGMVLVDGLHPREWLQVSDRRRRGLEEAVRFARRGAWLARLGIPRLILFLARVGGPRIARRFGSALSGGALQAGESLLTPVSKLPPELQSMVASFWTQPKSYETLADQMASLPESAEQVAAVQGYADLPLVVLLAGDCHPARRMSSSEAAQLSSRSKLVVAPASGHWIQLDQPQLVVGAIREVVQSGNCPPGG